MKMAVAAGKAGPPYARQERRIPMLYTIVIVLIVLLLLGVLR